MSAFTGVSSTLLQIEHEIVKAKGDGWRSAGIGMGSAAHDCWRKIWYDLRWVSAVPTFDARMLRLFESGEVYEERLLDYLESIEGVEVQRFTDDGKQLKAVLAGGFLRGKLDGRCMGLPEAPKTSHVVEIKSHNDKSFKELVKKRVQLAKPEHYAQMQSYMHAIGDKRALYLAVNKNDDDLYIERVEYDIEFCLKLVSKCESVAKSDTPPPKLHEDASRRNAFECKWCNHIKICQRQGFPESSNCRTCAHVRTVFDGNATFECTLHGRPLSYGEQKEGCSAHLFEPSLVPGEVTEFNEKTMTATYKLHNGKEWVDGGG